MPAPFILGWEEWLSLPELGLPAIKAKIDTGARTSALHAHYIEPFGPSHAPLVRFTVHPVARRDDIEIACSAPIADRRDVTSSNGESEQRYVILTRVRIGEREWPIEVTLTNRETMSYRMLLGRQAIQDDMFVDPTASFRQPRLSSKSYLKMPRQPPVHRPLHIAILTRKPSAKAASMLAAAAHARGHVVESLDVARLTLGFDGPEPFVMEDGAPLPHFDAVIPRIGTGGGHFARAVLRQFEAAGSFSPNRADVLERLSAPLAVRQILMRNGIATAGPPHVGAEHAEAERWADAADAAQLSVLVIGRRAVATVADRGLDASTTIAAAGTMAEAAAHALQLRLAAVDLVASADGLMIASVDTVPKLSGFARAGGIAPGELILADVESAARSWRRILPAAAADIPPASAP